MAPGDGARSSWRSRSRLFRQYPRRAILGATYVYAGAYSVALGLSVAAFAFGWLAPDDAFPVSYRRGGNAAHLELTKARTGAITRALRDQLGLSVTSIEPFGAEGSGGSTPLLMSLDDGSRVFGKILATSHVRADRWYRTMRTIMYGRLEDETSFSSVRQLIGQEDYALRLLDDQGFEVAHTYGIVELTPNQEYLLAEQFFDGADTLGHATVDDAIVDQGMRLVRRLWDWGLAHRDLKPANMLVVDGHLQVIDVSGLEVRPSPWRQAVDLANMMLVMGLRTDARGSTTRRCGTSRPRTSPRRSRCAGHGDPDRAPALPEGGSSRSGRRVPCGSPAEAAHLDPAVELTSDRAHGRGRGRHARGRGVVARRVLPRARLSYAGARITSGRALPPSSR